MSKDNQASRERQFSLGLKLKEAAREAQTAADLFDEACAQAMGINRTDARCMDIIDRLGPLTPGRLAAESGLTTGAVTAVIDRLEALDYVRRSRDATDRRRIWIAITDEASLIGQRLFGHYTELNTALMTRFSPAEIETVIAFMRIDARINHAFGTLLKDYVLPQAASNEDRVVRARAFQRDGHRLIETLSRAIVEGTAERPDAEEAG